MKTEKRISNYAAAPAQRGASRKTAAKGARLAPNKAYAHLSAGELRQLVAAAQRFEQNAIDKLCAAFKPLILKEAYAAHIVAKLGDDAVNTAWEIFLGFVQAYSKRSYRIFPTLARIHLHYELHHKAFRSNSVLDTVILDETDVQGRRLYNPSDENSLMDGLCNKQLAKELLTILSDKQRQVIVETIVNGCTLEKFARANGISRIAAYRLRERGLALLREKMK